MAKRRKAVEVTCVGAMPTREGLYCGLRLEHRSGWVLFSDVVVPWEELDTPEVRDHLDRLAFYVPSEDELTEPLFES
jgi:hypothetical protein